MALRTVNEARRMLSSKGKPVDRSRVYRWVRDGVKVRGFDGGAIKLRATRLPGGLVFDDGDLARFQQELQGAYELVQGGKRTRPKQLIASIVTPHEGPAELVRVGAYPPPPKRKLRLARDEGCEGGTNTPVRMDATPAQPAPGLRTG